jgi:hypothetical protein
VKEEDTGEKAEAQPLQNELQPKKIRIARGQASQGILSNAWGRENEP